MTALPTALRLAASGLPVLPLRAGKLPVGNCRACAKSACGDRPHMLRAGACRCPAPCHGWAAATTDPTVLNSRPWADAWEQAAAVAYHPGGAGLTVVDLDNADAVAWARRVLPHTARVATTRGEHWIYCGVMDSANNVLRRHGVPGVDIKSRMSYVRWRGYGVGAPAPLPDSVHTLVAKQPAPMRSAAVAATVSTPAGGGECPHRTPAYLERGVAMAQQRITEARSAIHATVYRTFLAVLSAHGRCGCLTEDHVARLFTAAQAKGETARHCTDAWTNARTKLGM